MCNDGARAAPFGANGMHLFGPGSSDMTAWRLTLAREFIGNVFDRFSSMPRLKEKIRFSLGFTKSTWPIAPNGPNGKP